MHVSSQKHSQYTLFTFSRNCRTTYTCLCNIQTGLQQLTVVRTTILNNILNHFQRVQNIAARILTRTKKYDHITPILQHLHWLPVRKRIIFKIMLLTYRGVNGIAPTYIECTPKSKTYRCITRSQLCAGSR